MTAGTYVLRLAANDGELITVDQVQITVLPPPSNTAPVVLAGPDLTITIGSQAVLNGTVTDDGLPMPSTITSTWTKVSGPGTSHVPERERGGHPGGLLTDRDIRPPARCE
jgi:hypothetical protein